MAEPDRRPVTLEELLVSSLAQTDAPAKLLIEKRADNPEMSSCRSWPRNGRRIKSFSVRRRKDHQSFASKRIDNTNEATEEVDEASGSFAFLRPCSW
jgi:hypothetical protein